MLGDIKTESMGDIIPERVGDFTGIGRYLELRGKARAGILPKGGKTFNQAADKFEAEYEVITEGERSPKWVEGHKIRLRVHLRPFFGKMPLSEITAGKVQDYRVERINKRLEPNPHSKSNRPIKDTKPARNTLDNEIITLRQVLKTAVRHGWLDVMPDLSPPYKQNFPFSMSVQG